MVCIAVECGDVIPGCKECGIDEDGKVVCVDCEEDFRMSDDKCEGTVHTHTHSLSLSRGLSLSLSLSLLWTLPQNSRIHLHTKYIHALPISPCRNNWWKR